MFEQIVGTSKPLQVVLPRIAKVSSTESTALIAGETGTRKELIARAVHKRSQRSRQSSLVGTVRQYPVSRSRVIQGQRVTTLSVSVVRQVTEAIKVQMGHHSTVPFSPQAAAPRRARRSRFA